MNDTKTPDQAPADATVKTTTEVPVNPAPAPTTPTTETPTTPAPDAQPAKAQGDGAGE